MVEKTPRKSNYTWRIYILKLPKAISGYREDKCYVGMTRVKPAQRWRNGHGYKSNEELWRDIQSFGWESFNKEVVFETDSHAKAAKKERECITKYNSTDKLFGYNHTNGGEGVLSDVTVVDSTREKHSQISKNRWLRKDFREKMSGKNCHFHNEVYSLKGGDNPTAIAVVLLNTGEYFECIRDASRKYGIDASHIGLCCKGKQRYSGSKNGVKYLWAFADDYEKMDKNEVKRRLKESETFYSNSAKRVIDITNMIVYPTCTKAAQIRGFSISTLTQHINGDGVWGNCQWRFLKDYLRDNEYSEEDLLNKCHVVA